MADVGSKGASHVTCSSALAVHWQCITCGPVWSPIPGLEICWSCCSVGSQLVASQSYATSSGRRLLRNPNQYQWLHEMPSKICATVPVSSWFIRLSQDLQVIDRPSILKHCSLLRLGRAQLNMGQLQDQWPGQRAARFGSECWVLMCRCVFFPQFPVQILLLGCCCSTFLGPAHQNRTGWPLNNE